VKIRLALMMGFILMAAMGASAESQWAVKEENGAPMIQTPSGIALSQFRLNVKINQHLFFGGFRLESAAHRSDRAGSYSLKTYRFTPISSPGMPPAPPAPFQATLELRHYRHPEALVATLDYNGPPPDAEDGVHLGMNLDQFARGMALHRLKLWWLTPTFISDPRLLAGDNALLLWQRMEGSDYHLLVALAGGGMVGGLKVLDFDRFGVSFSSHDPKFAPHRIPLFAYAAGNDPYQLPRDAYSAAFAANSYYGRLRWQKPYPEIFRSLGWCSWNAYYQQVTAQKLLATVQSLKSHGLPLGYVIIDDGWLSVRNQKLIGYEADAQKFPQGLQGVVHAIHDQYHIPHVGVWHAFQGYWRGVDPNSLIGKSHHLFAGDQGQYLPDPRNGAGESFFADWYRLLESEGIDFLKVDNQASNPLFTNGLLPLFVSGAGEQKNLQEAALRFFPVKSDPAAGKGVKVINCMAMSLENAFNWRYSNIARNSEDYFPHDSADIKNHTFYNAYNSYWTSNFAYPDWDEFQTDGSDAEYQAIGRAMSGGPVYITGAPGTERPEILLPLVLSDGQLLMLDAPSMPTRDSLLTNTAIEPRPLKIFGTITRPGLIAGMVAAFNVDKAAKSETGELQAADVDGITGTEIAVYQRSSGRILLLNNGHPRTPFSLGEFGSDLFTLVPVNHGVAVLGLLNKYLGPAAITRVEQGDQSVTVQLQEAGDLGAYCARRPAAVEINGRRLPQSAFTYSDGLLMLPQGSFGGVTGPVEVRLVR
jgi:raffinose synthase